MMDVRRSNLVTISCADHSQYVAIALRNLFDSKRGTDFDFRLGEKSVRAHRFVIELFLAPGIIKSEQTEPFVTPEVKQEVPDDGYGSRRNILDIVLEFLYKGEADVPEHQLEELLGVARELDFQMLLDAVHACRPVDIIPEDEQNIETQSGVYCFDNANQVRELLEPRIEDNLDSFDNTECMELDMNCEQAVKHCSVNLGSRISGYQSMPDGVCDLGQPLHELSEEVAAPLALELPNSGSNEEDGGASRDDQLYQAMLDEPRNEKIAKRRATGQYQCPHCDFGTPKYSRHVSHLLKSHGLTPRGAVVQQRQCPHCEYQTSDYRSYRHHSLSVHQLTIEGEPAPKRKCPNCEYETSNSSSYQHHCLSAHQLTSRGEPAPILKCSKCDYTSVYLGLLKRHIVTKHTQERNFACPQCSYVGNLKFNLKRHLNLVHGVGGSRHTCKECGQRCESRVGLERHVRTHTKERPFKCPHCEFDSNYERALNIHVNRVH